MKKNPFRTDNTIIVFTSEKMETIMYKAGQRSVVEWIKTRISEEG